MLGHTLDNLAWHDATVDLPDADTSVLVAIRDEEDSYEGYLDGETWCYAQGTCVIGEVYAWAHMPAAPDLAMPSFKRSRRPRRKGRK